MIIWNKNYWVNLNIDFMRAGGDMVGVVGTPIVLSIRCVCLSKIFNKKKIMEQIQIELKAVKNVIYKN